MKHLSRKEISILYFTAYFLYGRSKYGDLERGDIRLARIAACRGVMQIGRSLGDAPQPVHRIRLDEAFSLLAQQAERLPEGTFKTVYLETLERLRQTL